MKLVRIGQKLIDQNRILRRVSEILSVRAEGKSQQETADLLGVDRPFVSRIESIGEVRRGGRIAVVGFPVGNKTQLAAAARQAGVDYLLLFTEAERRQFAGQTAGPTLINELMQITADLQSYDTVIFLGSDMRIRQVEAMIDRDAFIGIEIGRSPIQEDVWVDPDPIVETIERLKTE